MSNFFGYQEPIATADPNWNSTLSKQFLIFTQITFIRLLSVLFDLTDTLYTIRHGWRQSCNVYNYIDFISSVYRIVYYMSKHVSKCWQKNYPVCDLLDLYIHGVERYRGQWGWQAPSIQGTGRRGYLSINAHGIYHFSRTGLICWSDKLFCKPICPTFLPTWITTRVVVWFIWLKFLKLNNHNFVNQLVEASREMKFHFVFKLLRDSP